LPEKVPIDGETAMEINWRTRCMATLVASPHLIRSGANEDIAATRNRTGLEIITFADERRRSGAADRWT